MVSQRKDLLEKFFNGLISGDRRTTALLVRDALEKDGQQPDALLSDLCWPVLAQMQMLRRQDQISALAYHYATRQLQQLVAQLHAGAPRGAPIGETVLVATGDEITEELAGQIVTALLEQAGYTAYFCGGGVPNDELVAELTQIGADKLVVFGATSQTVPGTRLLISRLHEIGACPHLQVIVGGGVFNRAEGLAEVLGADLWADDPAALVQTIQAQPDRRTPATRHTLRQRRRQSSSTRKQYDVG